MADDPDKPVSTNPFVLLGEFLRWLLRQEIRDVMLIGTQIALVYGLYLGATEWLPKYNADVSAGYKAVAAEHSDAIDKIIANDKERRIEDREYETERYQWIKDMWLSLKAKLGAVMPKFGEVEDTGAS